MIDVHRQAFKVEAQELLAELETALLELDASPTDMELIQRTFRALHTTKGSGAMFGFDAVSRFTHQVETAFDDVREGRLPVTSDLVNLTLAARDQIRDMLEGADDAQAEARGAEILEKLKAFTLPMQLGAVAGGVPNGGPAHPSGVLRRCHIRFRPFREILLQGANPLLLFRELGDMGNLQIETDVSALPELSQMDPESSYLGWELRLDTTCQLEAVRGVFIFFEDDSELSIEELPLGPQPADGSSLSPPPSADPKREPWTLGSVDTRRDPYSVGGDKVSIRVAIERVDSLINFVGELVTVQAQLSQLATRSDTSELRVAAEEIERLTSGLRDNAISMRMLPLKATFDRFRRLVHDLTRELGKDVEFSTEGADTELDKTVIDQLNDPLLHLIRNSMDHGSGSPEERVAVGKPRAGRIRLSAAYSGANVLISVSDDGKGLNVPAIRARAVEKGLIQADAQLTDSEIHALILAPGFSTAAQVTDLSGRGVGMDVVRRNVEALRGMLEIKSQPGAGTSITLRLPLTLAITLLRGKDPQKRLYRVVPELREVMEFRRLNLMDTDFGVGEPVDIIFCRNVIIYFDPPTRNRLLQRFTRQLRPGGYLFLGHSETLHGLDVPLIPAGPTIYRKQDATVRR